MTRDLVADGSTTFWCFLEWAAVEDNEGAKSHQGPQKKRPVSCFSDGASKTGKPQRKSVLARSHGWASVVCAAAWIPRAWDWRSLTQDGRKRSHHSKDSLQWQLSLHKISGSKTVDQRDLPHTPSTPDGFRQTLQFSYSYMKEFGRILKLTGFFFLYHPRKK